MDRRFSGCVKSTIQSIGVKAILVTILFVIPSFFGFCLQVQAADKLIGIHSSQVLAQSMPWIAEEAGLFKKHGLDFQLVS